jgi:hypothetical protein
VSDAAVRLTPEQMFDLAELIASYATKVDGRIESAPALAAIFEYVESLLAASLGHCSVCGKSPGKLIAITCPACVAIRKGQ